MERCIRSKPPTMRDARVGLSGWLTDYGVSSC
jgi:hypothetical protein